MLALPEFREAMRRGLYRRHGPRHRESYTVSCVLSRIYRADGDRALAEPALPSSLAWRQGQRGVSQPKPACWSLRRQGSDELTHQLDDR